MEYEILWNGAHRGVDADLLCVHPALVRDVPEATVTHREMDQVRDYQYWTAVRARVLALLESRESWRIKELHTAMGLDQRSRVIHGIVQRLRRHRQVRTVAYGTIALVRRQTGAAA